VEAAPDDEGKVDVSKVEKIVIPILIIVTVVAGILMTVIRNKPTCYTEGCEKRGVHAVQVCRDCYGE
jgi:hypothetical protein